MRSTNSTTMMMMDGWWWMMMWTGRLPDPVWKELVYKPVLHDSRYIARYMLKYIHWKRSLLIQKTEDTYLKMLPKYQFSGIFWAAIAWWPSGLLGRFRSERLRALEWPKPTTRKFSFALWKCNPKLQHNNFSDFLTRFRSCAIACSGKTGRHTCSQ